ncbi:MAG: putative ATPase [Phenylobacterium sp.]|jgi:predicted ATPase
MLNEITIKGFKCIEDETLVLKPLTLLTGRNSTGKSSVIQAFLLLAKHAMPANQYSLAKITAPYSDARHIRNKFTNTQSIDIRLPTPEHKDIELLGLVVQEKQGAYRFTSLMKPTADLDQRISNGEDEMSKPLTTLLYEPAEPGDDAELFYLSASRTGPKDVTPVSDIKVGMEGEYLLSSFERLKREPVPSYLVHFKESNSFGYQVSRWLSYITDTKTELKTEKLSNDIKVTLNTDGLEDVSPLNVGAGLSYVAKVVILCLMAKKDDLILLENPEIHLHPKAQALLGAFLAFIASQGIQLIVETHCEHLINKVRYQVYERDFDADEVVIHYKNALREPFEQLRLSDNGQYVDQGGERMAFPTGFFDGTLTELMAMGG